MVHLAIASQDSPLPEMWYSVTELAIAGPKRSACRDGCFDAHSVLFRDSKSGSMPLRGKHSALAGLSVARYANPSYNAESVAPGWGYVT